MLIFQVCALCSIAAETARSMQETSLLRHRLLEGMRESCKSFGLDCVENGGFPSFHWHSVIFLQRKSVAVLQVFSPVHAPTPQTSGVKRRESARHGPSSFISIAPGNNRQVEI